ncbi:two component, sigma54 specific, transcriptional regulator, Fis family [Ancylobacter novellus DSM 506]|uniref:Two component, sigma54 specific, transcriptional regulator, Fis family n=1 Tax=Ancylobacter novellus (strain ATCC 8093 / DSM 506 / JCM 20403 / CCM 1077 / IAM 12100 / NBRC 12443 / NCIMB 10456) TaxID=639283 RepID=D7A8D0_ANCN5|nr:sigma-54 dependent transcriptional regulator [Ancylobacter novellus]ADH88603.1 two component, sigma54 specific, transcriptional regulator, Fis family [Ancylobacter novellus DSM 506]
MSPDAPLIGLVEDDSIMGESLVQRLALEGVTVKWWLAGTQALGEMGRHPLQAVVCDIRLPDLSGEALFREVVRVPNAPPFLFITGHGDIDQAVRLMRAGAVDYVTKPFEMDDFLARLGDLVRGHDPATQTLGMSPAMLDVEHLLRRVARINSNVLITGETGTGKDVAARLLHAASADPSTPFVAVNCAAIPTHLMESELFGHEKGAFTGAVQRHAGYAERAANGILFLDEIAELRPDLQAKLLRLIEERTLHRVGGERPVPFRGRLVTATNADLPSRVREGSFREDLFYRVNVVTIRLPALRERLEDIPWLMDRFFAELSEQLPTQARGISGLAQEAALAHAWPGNVRELRNRMERAVALAMGPWLMPGDLFPESAGRPVSSATFESLETARLEAERRHIVRALAATNGEISGAARLLGIGRTTLWEKMRRLGLDA